MRRTVQAEEPVLRCLSSKAWRIQEHSYPERCVSSGGFLALPTRSCTADLGNLPIDFAHGQLVGAVLFGFGPCAFEPVRGGGDGIDVILDAHHDSLRLAASADDEALIFGPDALEDLSELGTGRQGGDHGGCGFGLCLHGSPPLN